jgi:hypothetical protein
MALGPQFEQLKMFMTPAEIAPSGGVDSDGSTIVEHHERDPELTRDFFKRDMARKAAEARSSGLTNDIMERGVVMPVQVIHTPELGRTLGHGHHRFAAAEEIDPDMLIPVHHTQGQLRDTKYGHQNVRELSWWPADAEYESMHGLKGTGSHRMYWA